MIPISYEQKLDRSLISTVEAGFLWTISSASAVFPLTAAPAAGLVDA